MAVVRYLVKQGADKEKVSNDGRTPLFLAALKNRLEIVRYLVEQGADKDKAMDGNKTPLLVAAERGYMAVVRYLVEQGADMEKATDTPSSPSSVIVVAPKRCSEAQGMDAGRGRRCVHACVNRLLWARLRKHNDDPGTKTRKLTAFVSGFPKKRPKAGLRKHST